MRPELFELFGTSFPSYFVLLIFGFTLSTADGVLWARRLGMNPDVIVDLGLVTLLTGVLGARLLHVLVDGYFWDYVHLCTAPELVSWPIRRAECERMVNPDFVAELFGAAPQATGVWDEAGGVCRPAERDCFAWARFWAGGLTYYGGFLGGSLGAYWTLKRDRFPFWMAADMAALVIPIGLGLGRIGCLLGGCCFGSPVSAPFGISFPAMSPASSAQARAGLLSGDHLHSLPVYPTQLLESFASLALGAWLFFVLHGKKSFHGQVFAAFVLGYAALRFVLEFFRADDRGGFLWFSTSQWLGLLLGAAALALHGALARRARKLEASVREDSAPLA